MNQLWEYHRQLEQNNAYMISRMEELYKGIRTNSITLVPISLWYVCALAL
ncbi:MAG: hypothetical protein Q4C54_01265 [Clostridia bacterium]|nr:hypothetical protein [Clostridia bacterium]